MITLSFHDLRFFRGEAADSFEQVEGLAGMRFSESHCFGLSQFLCFVPHSRFRHLRVMDHPVFVVHNFMSVIRQWPNKSPEPTAVIAGSSAIAVHVVVRLWLSFHRSPNYHGHSSSHRAA